MFLPFKISFSGVLHALLKYSFHITQSGTCHFIVQMLFTEWVLLNSNGDKKIWLYSKIHQNKLTNDFNLNANVTNIVS